MGNLAISCGEVGEIRPTALGSLYSTFISEFPEENMSYCSRPLDDSRTPECKISTESDPRNIILGSFKAVYRPKIYKCIYLFKLLERHLLTNYVYVWCIS